MSGYLDATGYLIEDVRNIEPKDINLDHILHCLSRIYRYNGATRRPVSVLQHTYAGYLIAVDYLPGVDERFLLSWLMHDFHEAYFGDIPTDFKRWNQNLSDEIDAMSDKIDAAIFGRFAPGMTPCPYSELRGLDLLMLYVERKFWCDNPEEYRGDIWDVFRTGYEYIHDEEFRMDMRFVIGLSEEKLIKYMKNLLQLNGATL